MLKDLKGEGRESPLGSAQRFVLDTSPETIPEPALQAASLLMLDTLGVCIAAQPMDAGRIAREAATRLYNSAEAADRAPMMFDGREVSRAGAAFAGATQIDNLDAHDGYNPTKGHMGVVMVPALVAAAWDDQKLSGREALCALVVGYEIAGRAGIALHDTVSDYHTSGAWNAIGVAALAARTQGLSQEELRHAWGIAEYHGPRSQMMREIANPTMLHDGAGMGALVGMSAAVLAKMGFTGAPAITIEAPECACHWRDLEHFWQIEHQYIKPYPVCRWAHAAIDAVRELRIEHGMRPEDITGIEVRSFQNAVRLFDRVPETTSQAQYSLAFAVAVMAVHGTIALDHISGSGLNDPDVARLVGCTSAIEDARHEANFPSGRWADVTVHLRDGRSLHSEDTHARGGPERPFSRKDIIEKFNEYAYPILGNDRADAIRDAVLSLPEDRARFSDLSRHLFAAP